jgi:hypothetical protein
MKFGLWVVVGIIKGVDAGEIKALARLARV